MILPTATERFQWRLQEHFLDLQKIVDEKQDTATALKRFLHEKKAKLFELYQGDQGEKTLLSRLPEPWTMKDIRKATERILKALIQGEKITIFGDYDVDGTTSCAMLQEFFSQVGHPVDVYIPDRMAEGYGLNPTGVRRLQSQGTKVIITVDNGIAATEACLVALECGIDVIITDHHDVPGILPKAYAILNPKQKDCAFPYVMLAGVGVAFYLLIALRSISKDSQFPISVNLKQFLDFVAIGTIADMAPLTGVNHILCKLGLQVLWDHLSKGQRPGIRELLLLAGWPQLPPISAVDVGFKIGPRLNASGRLGNALRSVELLTTNTISQAHKLASFLHGENATRQDMERDFASQAIELALKENVANDPCHAFVLHEPHWHPGVVGLVATRVLDRFYKPTLIFGSHGDKLKGSGRSTHFFDLFTVLNEVRHEFLSFGGHFHAVGLTLEPKKLPWLKNYLDQKAQELIPLEQTSRPLVIDGHIPFPYLKESFVSALEDFEPFGVANPRPRWLVGPAEVRHIKPIGKDPKKGHAKVLLIGSDGTERWVTAFGLAVAFETILNRGVPIYAVVESKKGFWQGRSTCDIFLVDFTPVL